MHQDDLEAVLSDEEAWHEGYQCLSCGDYSHPEDLCSCCSRCIDCIAEIGHRVKVKEEVD